MILSNKLFIYPLNSSVLVATKLIVISTMIFKSLNAPVVFSIDNIPDLGVGTVQFHVCQLS